MIVKKIVIRRHGENRVLTDPDFHWLKDSFLFVCPVERGRIVDQIVKALAVHTEVLDVTVIKAKASEI